MCNIIILSGKPRDCFSSDVLDIVSKSLNGLVHLTNVGGTKSIIVLSGLAWIWQRRSSTYSDENVKSIQSRQSESRGYNDRTNVRETHFELKKSPS
jgi:hypothetical protein